MRWMRTLTQCFSTRIILRLLVYERLEVVQVSLQVLQQAVEGGQPVVDEGAQVAVQALEGGEAVVVSHGEVEWPRWASCAGRQRIEGGEGGQKLVEAGASCFVCSSKFPGRDFLELGRGFL